MQLFYKFNYNSIFDCDFATYAEIPHPVNLNHYLNLSGFFNKHDLFIQKPHYIDLSFRHVS